MHMKYKRNNISLWLIHATFFSTFMNQVHTPLFMFIHNQRDTSFLSQYSDKRIVTSFPIEIHCKQNWLVIRPKKKWQANKLVSRTAWCLLGAWSWEGEFQEWRFRLLSTSLSSCRLRKKWVSSQWYRTTERRYPLHCPASL